MRDKLFYFKIMRKTEIYDFLMIKSVALKLT